MKKFSLIIAICLCALPAKADFLITVTGTVSVSTVDGYSVGDSITSTVLISSAYTTDSTNCFSTLSGNESSQWYDTVSDSTYLISNFSITGASGTYCQSLTAPGDGVNFMYDSNGRTITLTSTLDPGTGNLAFGSDAITDFVLQGIMSGTTLPGLGTETNLMTFLSGITGSYALSATGSDCFVDTASSKILTFTPTSLTIQNVPEPSTYAGITGLAVLGAAALVRRKRK